MNTPLHHRAARLAVAIVVASMLAFSSSAVIAGDDDQRIQFAPGSDSGSVNGTFREGEVDTFVLSAAAGQKMFVSVTPPEAGAAVAAFAPDGSKIGESPEPGADFSVDLAVTGDYTITVGPGRSEVTNYTLFVRIPPMAPAPQPEPSPPTPSPTDCQASTSQRIQFAPGTDNATVQGSTPPGTFACYVLRASAGQTITVSFGPDEFAALANLIGPDDNIVAAWHTGGSATLPQTGDYIIDVGNTGSTIVFTLTVRIPATTAPAPASPSGQLPTTR
jgi:hypothetical protein